MHGRWSSSDRDTEILFPFSGLICLKFNAVYTVLFPNCYSGLSGFTYLSGKYIVCPVLSAEEFHR